MCSVPPLGALKKGTTDYVYPAIATKANKYVCPECSKDLILRAGTKRVKHFAHFASENPCTYYDKPSEAQIHKDAKMLLKHVLISGKTLTVRRACIGEGEEGNCCRDGNDEESTIPPLSETSKIVLEYRFKHNGRLCIADVAYLDEGEIVCMFEICNTHKTTEGSRPEPWFELDASALINSINKGGNDAYVVSCMRHYRCDDCEMVPCSNCGKLIMTHIRNLSVINECRTCHMGIDIPFNIYVEVPYSEKDEIKKYGGKFNGQVKKWYIRSDSSNKNIVLNSWKRVFIAL